MLSPTGLGMRPCVSYGAAFVAALLVVLRVTDLTGLLLCCISLPGPQVSTTHPPTTHSPPAYTTSTDLPSAEPTTPSNCVEVGDVSFHSTPPLSTLPPPNRPPAAMQTQGAESSPVGTTNMSECASFCLISCARYPSSRHVWCVHLPSRFSLG